jgi:iron complex outermembrane receptor protein
MQITINKALRMLLLTLLYTNFVFSQSTIKKDTIYASTLTTVNVYSLKGKQTNKVQKLTHADWVKHDAGDVLSQIPGFSSIKKSGNFGFDPVFRGFKWEQLSILNDGGLTAHAACPNRMDPPTSQVMINQVEKIEIMKGPHNFRFGPSTGAVINFKTASPEFPSSGEFFGRLNMGKESNGDIFRSEGMLGHKSKRLQIITAGSYSNGTDYKDGLDSIIPATFSRGALNLNTAYLVKPNQVFSLNVTRNFAKNTDFPTLMMDLLSDDTWMIQGKYAIKSTTRWYNEWNSQIFNSQVQHQMGNGLRPTAASMLSHVYSNTETSGGRTEFVINKNSLNIYFGGDLKYEYANGNRTRKMITGMMAGKTFTDTLWQKANMLRTGIFTHIDKKLGRFDFSFSTRLDKVVSNANEPSKAFLNTYTTINMVDVNPSISIGANTQIAKNVQVGVWAGRGVRSASITEKYINFLPVGLDAYEVVGNPMLKPEINNQVDMILQYRNTKTNIQATVFLSSVENYISSVVNSNLKPVIPTSPGVRNFVNIAAAKLYGFEFNWGQQLQKYLRNDFSATYTNGQNSKLDEPLPEIAPFELRDRVELSSFNNKLLTSISVRYAAKQDRVSAVYKERITESFTLFDMGLKYSLIDKVQLSLDAVNILDIAYREHLSRFISSTRPMNSPGRNFILMVSFNF